VLVTDDAGVGLADKLGFHGPALFQVVQVFEEQDPRCLLGIVQLGGAARLFPQDVVDVLEGLFEHASTVTTSVSGGERRRRGLRLLAGKDGRNGCGARLSGIVGGCSEADRSAAPASLGDRLVLDQRGVNIPVGIVLPSEFDLQLAVSGTAAQGLQCAHEPLAQTFPNHLASISPSAPMPQQLLWFLSRRKPLARPP
jgi:hypothetical protein